MVGPKRHRGRPRGTEKFGQQDRQLLADFADQLFVHPSTTLASFARQHGYADKDIGRVRQRWGREKDALMRAARRRAASNESVLSAFASTVEYLTGLKASAHTGIGMIAKNFERERRRYRRLIEQGLPPPLDLSDSRAVEAAIKRHDDGIHNMPAEYQELGLSELSFPQQLFLTAHLLHELSITFAEDEKLAARFGGARVA